MKPIMIGLIYLVLIGTVIYIFKILLDRAEQRDIIDTETKSKTKGKNVRLSAQDFINILDIKKGVMVFPNNYYALIIRAGTINYYLMSIAEKSIVINGLLGMANSITFPVQIYLTTELIDTIDAVKEIKNYYYDLPEVLKEYNLVMSEALTALRYTNNVMVKHPYIIIPYFSREGFEVVYSELTRRSMVIINGLNQSGIKGGVLSTLK
ncbi:hypothetical protein [Syntrophomonas palmitatica]|uniref:hypothetical protein n=1 Tax=Syntrophomonas palmitatica TaxID=402877 RepID=UPI0006D0B520|nr:hypothetical protein [Syntrophomonas palmitatica]